MSKGFKISLVLIGLYIVLVWPLFWSGIKAGNLAKEGAPVYLGLLLALLARQSRIANKRRNQPPGTDRV